MWWQILEYVVVSEKQSSLSLNGLRRKQRNSSRNTEMVFSDAAEAATSFAPLLADSNSEEDFVEGLVDHEGRPANRSKYGGWRSASLIIGVEITERFAYYGISSNLITYLTGPLQQSTAAAAESINAWNGVASLLPLVGAFVADSYVGRYGMILFASLLYVLGLGLLTLSAVLPFPSSPDCLNRSCSSPPTFQIIIFFFSLYLVAIAQSGHKPCVQAFGADQFDGRDPVESKYKNSFFNWWYFGLCAGTATSILILSYIQDNLNWGIGFGIPCISMAVALIVFLLGTRTYRYSYKGNEKSPFVRIAQVFVAAARNRRTKTTSFTALEDAKATSNHQFKFLDKALISDPVRLDDSRKGWEVCSASQVEEAKAVLRLVPIWTTCLLYAIVFAQSTTFFTKQGSTMDRSIGPSFKIPPAALQSFIGLSIVLIMPIYDRIFVPIARVITGKPAGITMLQRIGCGMFLSIISMVVAALVEARRLKIAFDAGIVDVPTATIPMSVWCLAPQYLMFGVSDVFTMVGLQEFFYDQIPNGLKSLGLALYLSIFGLGNFLSSFLISAIETATGGDGRDSWFSNNLNRAHLDYFYWLLAVLSAVAFVIYLYFAKSYVYSRLNTIS